MGHEMAQVMYFKPTLVPKAGSRRFELARLG